MVEEDKRTPEEEEANQIKLPTDCYTNKPESTGLAQSATEKWTADTDKMVTTFYDKAGGKLPVDQISE